MRFFLFLMAVMSGISPVIAKEQFQLVNRPDWVKYIDVPEYESIPHEQISNGVHYLLVDKQIMVPENEEPSFYRHYADLITNQTGLDEESQINISFDPIYQSVQLHKVEVKRGGLTVDMLSRARVTVLDQEDELDWQIYNGLKKINILLEDIRVGDVLEYSYTVTGRNPVFNNVFSVGHRLQWSVPVAQVSIGVYWQKPSKLFSKISNSDLQLLEKPSENSTEYWLEARDVEPILLDGDRPSWVDPFARIQFSEQPSWGSVVDWGSKLFEPVIKADQAIVEIANGIRSSSDNVDQQIAEALKFVQSEVRYVGIEFGQNSHQASPASVTLDRRYGDCKDKTVLLISLLRELGIESYPALVNTDARQTLVDWLPMNNAFDHAIAVAYHNDKAYWLDPTRQYQIGKLNEIFQPRYRYALVLDQKSDVLTPMAVAQTDAGYFVSDEFDLKSDKFGEVTMTSHSEYVGLNAERQRNNVARDGLSQIRKDYLEFYRGYYPSIEKIDAPRFYEDEESGRFMLKEKYNIPGFWKENKDKSKFTASVYSNAINWYLNKPDDTTRSQDYLLKFPANIKHNITLILDADEWQFENEKFTVFNEFFEYKRLTTFRPELDQLTLEYYYKSFSDHVPAALFSDYLTQLRRARKDLDYNLEFSYGKAESGNFSKIWQALAWLILLLGMVIGILFLLSKKRTESVSGS